MKRLIVFAVLVCSLGAAYASDRSAGLVLVKGGSFEMGVPNGKENPAHVVTVSSFFLSRREVTVSEWRDFTASEKIPWPWNADAFTGLVGRGRTFVMPDQWPIYYVSWFDAIRYCNWLSKREGLNPAYRFSEVDMRSFQDGRGGVRPSVKWIRDANGYRLPTEAEWEYAAFSGKTGDSLEKEAWYSDNSGGEPHPVGTRAPNGQGVLDMLGNVSEWCWDYFDPSYYAVSAPKDPTGASMGTDPENFSKNETNIRVNRGGSWINDREELSITFRFRSLDVTRGFIGVRVVRNAEK